MRTEQNRWTEDRGREPARPEEPGGRARPVFVSGGRGILKIGIEAAACSDPGTMADEYGGLAAIKAAALER